MATLLIAFFLIGALVAAVGLDAGLRGVATDRDEGCDLPARASRTEESRQRVEQAFVRCCAVVIAMCLTAILSLLWARSQGGNDLPLWMLFVSCAWAITTGVFAHCPFEIARREAAHPQG